MPGWLVQAPVLLCMNADLCYAGWRPVNVILVMLYTHFLPNRPRHLLLLVCWLAPVACAVSADVALCKMAVG